LVTTAARPHIKAPVWGSSGKAPAAVPERRGACTSSAIVLN